MLRNEDIEMVKSQVSMWMLAEHFGIRVNRKGFAKCPFHNEKTGSMKIYRGERGYYCFGCGAGGSIFDFVMEYCHMGFEESVKYIAGVFGIRISGKSELTADEKTAISHQMQMRKFEIELQGMRLHALSILSEKIRFYEQIQQNAEPFGKLFCWISNQLPVMQGQWDELYESIYGAEGIT